MQTGPEEESLICSLFRFYTWSGKHAKALIKAFNEIRDLLNNQVWTNGSSVRVRPLIFISLGQARRIFR